MKEGRSALAALLAAAAWTSSAYAQTAPALDLSSLSAPEAPPEERAPGPRDFASPNPVVSASISKDDLPKIVERKQLRFLVHGAGDQWLPRAHTPAAKEKELALGMGKKLGVQIEFVMVESHDQLAAALVEGKGDVLIGQVAVTPEMVSSREIAPAAEVVIGRKGDPTLPRAPKDLAGRRVFARRSSTFAATLEKLASSEAPGLSIGPIPEVVDDEGVLDEVSRSTWSLSVVHSHVLKALAPYYPEVEELFPIGQVRGMTWKVRKANPRLRTAVDNYLTEKAMTQHTAEVFLGDLEGVRKRNVLRVLTRNDPISYFVYRGEQLGFDYELAKMITDKLGVRLEIVVPPSEADLIKWLKEGKGDIVAAGFIPPEPQIEGVAFSAPYAVVDEVLVQRGGTAPIASMAELAGKKVHVAGGSCHERTASALATTASFVAVSETAAVQDLIEQVAEGSIPYTVAPGHVVAVEGPDVRASLVLASKREVVFAVRDTSKELRAFVDGFVRAKYRGMEYNVLKKRYFEASAWTTKMKDLAATETGRISPYDALFKKYGEKYGLDWRLLAAQAYAESRFDPQVKSWAGAIGVFQVMPGTMRALGFNKPEDVEEGVHAGVKYMSEMMSRFDPTLDLRQRVRFALAAYNVGLGHVLDARRLAAEQGLDPNRWFHNVEKAMLMLEKAEHNKRARHGYCRGSEPVKYVSKIQTNYDAYVKMVPLN